MDILNFIQLELTTVKERISLFWRILLRIAKLNERKITDTVFQMRKNKTIQLSDMLEFSRKSCDSAATREFLLEAGQVS